MNHRTKGHVAMSRRHVLIALVVVLLAAPARGLNTAHIGIRNSRNLQPSW